MKQWLQSLEPRERRMVLGGAAALLLVLLYLLIWEPVANRVEQLRKGTQEQQALLSWMQQAAQEVKQLRTAAGRPVQLPKGQSLLAAIDSTAKAGQLGGALSRVQPDGEASARVWLEGANFDLVVRWLENLASRQGVTASNVVFESKEDGGKVDARLVLTSEGE